MSTGGALVLHSVGLLRSVTAGHNPASSNALSLSLAFLGSVDASFSDASIKTNRRRSTQPRWVVDSAAEPTVEQNPNVRHLPPGHLPPPTT